MGWRFDLKHANTVAYITLPAQKHPPRLTEWQLREFLGSIQGEYRERPPLWSENQSWVEEITRIARESSKSIQYLHGGNSEFLEEDVISKALANLRESLSRF